MTYYYMRKIGDEIILAKIENDAGHRYLNGKWVDYPYILREQYEDINFKEIDEQLAKKLQEKLN